MPITPLHRQPAVRRPEQERSKTVYPPCEHEFKKMLASPDKVTDVLNELCRRHGIAPESLPTVHYFEGDTGLFDNVTLGYYLLTSFSQIMAFNRKQASASTPGHEFRHFSQALLRGRLAYQDEKAFVNALIQGQVELIGTPGWMEVDGKSTLRFSVPKSVLPAVRKVVTEILQGPSRDWDAIATQNEQFVDTRLSEKDVQAMGGRKQALADLFEIAEREVDRFRMFRANLSLFPFLYNNELMADLEKPLTAAEKNKAIQAVKEGVAVRDAASYKQSWDNGGQYLSTPEECLARISGEAHTLRAMWQREKARSQNPGVLRRLGQWLTGPKTDPKPKLSWEMRYVRDTLKIQHRLLQASRALHRYYQTLDPQHLENVNTLIGQIKKMEQRSFWRWVFGCGSQAREWLAALVKQERDLMGNKKG